MVSGLAAVAAVARIARVAMEKTAQAIAQPMAVTFAAAGVLATAATARAATRRDDRRRSHGSWSGLLVRTAACLTDQHCRCHQQERSIHEDSSVMGKNLAQVRHP
jgi:hypothetical protein